MCHSHYNIADVFSNSVNKGCHKQYRIDNGLYYIEFLLFRDQLKWQLFCSSHHFSKNLHATLKRSGTFQLRWKSSYILVSLLFCIDKNGFCWDAYWAWVVNRALNENGSEVQFIARFNSRKCSTCIESTQKALYASVKSFIRNKSSTAKNNLFYSRWFLSNISVSMQGFFAYYSSFCDARFCTTVKQDSLYLTCFLHLFGLLDSHNLIWAQAFYDRFTLNR